MNASQVTSSESLAVRQHFHTLQLHISIRQIKLFFTFADLTFAVSIYTVSTTTVFAKVHVHQTQNSQQLTSSAGKGPFYAQF